MPSSLTTEVPRAVRRALQACAGLACLVLVFEGLRAAGILPATSVPSTGAIVKATFTSLSDGEMTSAIGYTLLAWVLGLLVSAGLGIPAGIAIGLSEWSDATTKRAVEVLRPIPAVALVPVAIVLFGIKLPMQIFLITVACIWPLLLGARGGSARRRPVADRDR